MAEHKHAQTIRRYFDACNEADYDKLVSCFTTDAVHYFPDGLPDIPWRTADTIARKWQWCVENLGSQWTIEKILISHDSDEAVIEWTHWKIKEIRAYYASPADKQVTINELVSFDYAGRGYHLEPLAHSEAKEI
jgi:ketosteroid isomerase-like protein